MSPSSREVLLLCLVFIEELCALTLPKSNSWLLLLEYLFLHNSSLFVALSVAKFPFIFTQSFDHHHFQISSLEIIVNICDSFVPSSFCAHSFFPFVVECLIFFLYPDSQFTFSFIPAVKDFITIFFLPKLIITFRTFVIYFCLYLFIIFNFVFIFGCTGSLLLYWAFLQLWSMSFRSHRFLQLQAKVQLP